MMSPQQPDPARLVRALLDEWDLLVVDGAPPGPASVVPVMTADGPAMLKVAPPDVARHEALALRHWHGRGAVRLLRADPRRGALLLERLSAQDLTGAWDVEACEIVAGLYGRLHVPAPPQLARLSTYAAGWAADLSGGRSGALPRRIVEQAAHLARAFATDPATDGALVHGDLHYGNVLAGDRESWSAISPRPLSGDPHVEVAPLLSHRWAEVATSKDVRGTLRRRFHAVVDTARLDEERARDWVIVREAAAALTDGGTDRASISVAVIKAVQE
ncbi:MAG: aminoglycoside resistance protein [Aeromicrobium sp.]|jgi:streptomycin 6-kinase|nr:aminoglycoside resistance protein [Aeromicrobium sp.]